MMMEKDFTEREYGHLREKNDAPARAMAAGRTTTGAAGGAGLGTQGVSMMTDGNCALSGYSSSRKPPKIPKDSAKAVSWLRRLQIFLASEGLEQTLEDTYPCYYVPVISCLDRTYLNRVHGAALVTAHKRAWGYLLEATCGTDIEERLAACDCVPTAWRVIREWVLPTFDADKTLLVRQLETVEMSPGEDPKLFFARVDGIVNTMRAVGIEKSEREIVHIIVRQLSPEYDVERKSILADPTIPRAKVENVVRTAYANNVEIKELGKAQAIGGLGCGHGGGGQKGKQRRWQQQQQHQRWVHPQPPPVHHPPPNFPTWGSGGLYDCGRNAVYPQEESATLPGAPMGGVHQCVRCGRHGHSLGDCNAPRRFEGNCTACGEYGHRRRMCTIDRMQQRVHVRGGEGLNASGNDASPYQQRKRRRWRGQRQRSGRQSELLQEFGLWGGQPEYPHLQPEQPYSQRNRPETLPVFEAGAVSRGTAPTAEEATGGGGFPATAAGGTVGEQTLEAGAAAAAAAPAARAATPGNRVFPAAAAAGGAVEAQALAAGMAALAEASAVRAANPDNRVFPAAAVGGAAGVKALAAGVTVSAVAPAASSAGGPVAPALSPGGGVAAPTSTATPASVALEAEGECKEDSRWLDNDDKGGNSSDGSGDGNIVALSAGAGHPGTHPTVYNGICTVRDDGG